MCFSQGAPAVSMCVLLVAAEGDVAPRDVLEHVRRGSSRPLSLGSACVCRGNGVRVVGFGAARMPPRRHANRVARRWRHSSYAIDEATRHWTQALTYMRDPQAPSPQPSAKSLRATCSSTSERSWTTDAPASRQRAPSADNSSPSKQSARPPLEPTSTRCNTRSRPELRRT